MTHKIIPFFKLRYAYETRWRVADACKYLYGLDPRREPEDIRGRRAIDEFVTEMKDAISRNVIRPVGASAYISEWTFPIDSILTWAQDVGLPIDIEIVDARNWAKGNIRKKPVVGPCDASFFQNLALALWVDFEITKPLTSSYLEKYHSSIAEKMEMWVFPKTAETINEYLRFVSNKGTRERINVCEENIDDINLDKISKKLKKQ